MPTLVYLVLLIGFLTYNSVKFVPNVYSYNTTIGNVTTTNTGVYYTNDSIVPVSAFHDNDQNYITFDKALIILIVTIVYIFIMLQGKDGGIIPLWKIKLQFQEEVLSRKDVDGLIVWDVGMPVFRTVDDGAKIHDSWVVWGDIKYSDTLGIWGGNRIQAFEYDAHTGEKKGEYWFHEFPTGNHWKCDVCGKFPDTKVISPDYIKKIAEGMGMKLTGK